MKKTYSLGDIQFYWRFTKQPNFPKNVVPDFLPFEFTFEESTQLIRQKTTKTVLDALHTIYLEEFNVGYLQEGHALAESYGNDVVAFVNKVCQSYPHKLKKIAEVGCGGGYMLNKFRKNGFDIVGIDPSPIAVDAGEKFNYEVIKDFYPVQNNIQKFDVIFHYDVLEHIDNPIAFLKAHAKDLSQNGLIIFAVPNDTHCIEVGDASMVIHEHINYFDHQSLRLIVEASGFDIISIENSNYGGVLYCAAKISNKKQERALNYESQKFDQFIFKLNQFKNKLITYVKMIEIKEGNQLGVYIPLRIFPYLSDFISNSKLKVRFFDDDPGVYGKYYDGFNISIENFEDLKKTPVTHIIVASHVFGEKIKNKILSNLSEGIEVKTLADFTS